MQQKISLKILPSAAVDESAVKRLIANIYKSKETKWAIFKKIPKFIILDRRGSFMPIPWARSRRIVPLSDLYRCQC